jgi:hypothetical protein
MHYYCILERLVSVFFFITVCVFGNANKIRFNIRFFIYLFCIWIEFFHASKLPYINNFYSSIFLSLLYTFFLKWSFIHMNLSEKHHFIHCQRNSTHNITDTDTRKKFWLRNCTDRDIQQEILTFGNSSAVTWSSSFPAYIIHF